jgi:hypothetical protein
MSKFWSSIVGFFRGPKWKKAQEVAKMIGDILPYVEMVVAAIAAASGNKTVADIDNVLKQLSVPATEVPFDPSKEYTKSEINGILMGAANWAIRGELNKAIKVAGGAGLMVGGKVIKDHTEIPDNIINTASGTAYTYIRNAF